MDRFPSRNWLRWILFAVGGFLLVAMVPVFFPVRLMAFLHQQLGLGEFPDQPITLYLARSTSMLYAAHGAFIVFIARDIDRHWNLVPVIGWLHVLMGVTMLGIDLTSPMPTYWIVGEGVPIALAGLFIVWMWKRCPAKEPVIGRS